MDVKVFNSGLEASQRLAERVAAAVRGRPSLVLGLPTGRSPLETYAELSRMSSVGSVDFREVTTFNLDEFVGIPASDPRSFRQFMERHFFSRANIDAARIGFLNGTAADLDAECVRYESAIERAGGVGLQLLGIGSNGHIGFNEPGDELASRTHRIVLLESTRRANAPLFGGNANDVPREALSMGVGTILNADAIALIATGLSKARCVERAVRGPVTTKLPASFLQLHRRVELYLDRAAASLL